ncbi:MAG: PAS domain S-box protein [Chloroflexota bacterium]
MKQVLQNPHLWVILSIMSSGAMVYYADQVPLLRDLVTQAPIQLARYSTHRILSIIPVAYAAAVFRFRWGFITAVFISLALLPRPLFISEPSQVSEQIAEVAAFLFIGVLVSWLIDRRRQAILRLEKAKSELVESLLTINDQKEQLQLSEELYRGLFENAREAILVLSPSGRITSVNRAGQELTGRTPEELTAMNLDALFADSSSETVKQMVAQEGAGVVYGESEELRLVRKDGTEAFLRLKVSPLLKNDQVFSLQAIAHDVTEERRLRQNMEYYITQITQAQENERRRISRELHDETAQMLAFLSRGIDSIIAGDKKLPKPLVERLEKLHQTADSALEGVRRFSQALRPSVLDDLGLVPALQWLAADVEKQSGIATRVTILGNPHRLSPERELVVFRIAQEALSNVRRHSQATEVKMTIDFTARTVKLVISDNGRGFTVPPKSAELVRSGKLGIAGMRERVRLMGGTLAVQSQTGAGTTITLQAPAD